MENKFISTFDYKLIYIFRINDEAHKGLLKIGDATLRTNKTYEELLPSCRELNQAAKERINQYTGTAGISYELLYAEIGIYTDEQGKVKVARDYKVHEVLLRSGIKHYYFDTEHKQNEWFLTDLNSLDGVNDGVNTLIDDGVNEGLIDGVNDGVRGEGINTLDLATRRGKSKPTVERYLKLAKLLGVIEFRGAPKTGGYYLTKKMKKKLKE